jgi:pyruvate/2-oxoglutarate/acetoin dehydrogenase E1 component
MERDPKVLLMGEDIGLYGGVFGLTRGFLEHFGADRVIDTPIAEAGFTGAAAGLAHLGFRPVVEMQYMDFSSTAYNLITQYIATSRARGAGALPLVIRGPVGGGVGAGPFHSQNVEMAFFHTPGLKIVYPSNPADAKGLLKSAIRDDDPVLFEEHKALYRDPALRQHLSVDSEPIPLGQANRVRAGEDVTVVTYGRMVQRCLEAARLLFAEDGTDVEVLDLRTLLPLDDEAIVGSVRRTGRLLVVHEDTRTGGIAGEIAMRVSEQAFEWLDAPIRRVTAPDGLIPYASELEDRFLPTAEAVVRACRYLASY